MSNPKYHISTVKDPLRVYCGLPLGLHTPGDIRMPLDAHCNPARYTHSSDLKRGSLHHADYEVCGDCLRAVDPLELLAHTDL